MKSATWTLPIQPPFDFRSTVRSHGWVVLAPTSLDEDTDSVLRIEKLVSGKVLRLVLNSAGSIAEQGIQVTADYTGRLSEKQVEEVNRAVGRMFREEEDFQDFYSLCDRNGAPWSRMTIGAGRLLRSPALFEDIIKTICTTNIQWAGTKSMVRNLVDALGDPFPGDPAQKAFPTPEAIAGASPALLSEARLGYRGPYILKLAEDVASGALDLREYEDPDIPTEDLRKMLLRIKGVGGYAAATLLMLLGRYEFLGFDTEMRDFIARRYNSGQIPTEKQAFAIYERWGRWKYLAYWFDIYPVD